MKCPEDNCHFQFYETKDGIAEWTIHRILMHPKSQEELREEAFRSSNLGTKIASIEKNMETKNYEPNK
jgi:hypothetical protein